ncbi:MAG: sulfite exporter TauE/SafE family protein [Chloroflexi bacterium]|nr:sulfite exporter TauE/SafE family protein [Chloroflexota bacterium]MCI0576902.1 sulfite exporter TauE/SafE family protein [Chloroflexota bacterium]MCI0646444.1 sulfite exporter TauE/SafE family protein [Chloroflexota bacterium]MCI0731408.1 sulfite exporter TauE/SafE family protein [Chloroflexota bacterium]
MNGLDFVLVGLAAMAAGAVNALAGGGTLISFPALVAVGVPAVAANVTNTVALSPGYLGATLGQARDLRGQGRRLWLLAPAGVIGGVIGGVLLLNTGERVFRSLVPFLILLASFLLAVQEPVRNTLVRRAGREKQAGPGAAGGWTALPVGLAAIYGGYFGAGVSVIVLAVLGLVLDDSLTRLNALKQAISFSINVAAAVFFLFSGEVVWEAAGVMAVGAVIGGALGGRLAGRIRPAALRRVVVVVGVVVAIIYLVR